MAEEIDERVLLARSRTDLAAERNKLANIRTYLAWIRTGLASVGGGLAIIRFLSFHTPTHQFISQMMGSVLVFLGISMFCLSFLDYRSSYRKLKLHKDIPNSPLVLGMISGVLIAVSLLLLIITF